MSTEPTFAATSNDTQPVDTLDPVTRPISWSTKNLAWAIAYAFAIGVGLTRLLTQAP